MRHDWKPRETVGQEQRAKRKQAKNKTLQNYFDKILRQGEANQGR